MPAANCVNAVQFSFIVWELPYCCSFIYDIVPWMFVYLFVFCFVQQLSIRASQSVCLCVCFSVLRFLFCFVQQVSIRASWNWLASRIGWNKFAKPCQWTSSAPRLLTRPERYKYLIFYTEMTVVSSAENNIFVNIRYGLIKVSRILLTLQLLYTNHHRDSPWVCNLYSCIGSLCLRFVMKIESWGTFCMNQRLMLKQVMQQRTLRQ